jgi:hypothetical protein
MTCHGRYPDVTFWAYNVDVRNIASPAKVYKAFSNFSSKDQQIKYPSCTMPWMVFHDDAQYMPPLLCNKQQNLTSCGATIGIA